MEKVEGGMVDRMSDQFHFTHSGTCHSNAVSFSPAGLSCFHLCIFVSFITERLYLQRPNTEAQRDWVKKIEGEEERKKKIFQEREGTANPDI